LIGDLLNGTLPKSISDDFGTFLVVFDLLIGYTSSSMHSVFFISLSRVASGVGWSGFSLDLAFLKGGGLVSLATAAY
jgi:hypothetical protein